MNRDKAIHWLYGELNSLVRENVLDEATASRLLEHYGPVKAKTRSEVAIVIFSVIGATLIGLGIILVLGSNWDALGRPMRAALSFAPLVLAQALCGWVIAKQNDSVAWREGSSTFLMLSVAACIALIGQTYHIPGNLGGFLLTWQLLILPLAYLMRAIMPAIGYLAMITAWSAYEQAEGGHAAYFYLFAAGIAPFVWLTIREGRALPRTRVLLWAVALAPCVAIGIVLEKSIPGIWLLVYVSYFTLIYLMDATWLKHDRALGGRPFYGVGISGIAILSFIFTFEWPWRYIGWRYYRNDDRYLEWAGFLDYALLLAFLVPAVGFTVRAVSRQRYDLLGIGIAPVIAIVAWCYAAAGDDAFISTALFNFYILALSVSLIASGVKALNLGTVNVGLVMLFTLIVLRFFDVDMSFLTRGVTFIVLGICFLSTNLLLNRRFKEAT